MKQAVNYAEKTLQELLALAMAGDREAAAEIVARQEAQEQEIESLKAAGKRTPKAEKTPVELAKDNAYFRTALLVKEFGVDQVNMQTLTVASAFLKQGLSQGNLRQAFNRVTQILKAQKVEEQVFPEWILTAGEEIPVLDENKKLEEEGEKVEQIKAIVQEYMDKAAFETRDIPLPEAPEAPEAATTPAKKASKK